MINICEALSKLVKKIKIVDGKKKQVIEKVYKEDCKEGYKRNSETGACERMSLQEQRDRSKSAKKGANTSSAKRNKKISNKRREHLIGETFTAIKFLEKIRD